MHYQSFLRRIRLLLENKKVRFVAVGLLNTGIDFVIFNVAIFAFGLKPWIANLCSTSIAMALSFFINKQLVFRDKKTMRRGQFVAFILVTAIGLWGLQKLVILGAEGLLKIALQNIFSVNIQAGSIHWLTANGAKAAATVLSAIWNYIWYDRVIFAHSPLKNKLPEVM